MKEVHYGKEPVNCRIKIDYRKSYKPKVTFGYPKGNRKYLTKGSLFRQVSISWMLFFLIFLAFGGYNIILFDNYPNGHLGTNNYSKNILFTIVVMTIPPFIMYFPTKKHWLKLYPKYQRFWSKLSGSYIAIFFPKDVKDNKVEIPLFQNIYLDYRTQGDFTKYLETVEIKEHPFNEIERDLESKKKIKLMPNQWLWKAEFTFSQKPKIGKLITEFK